MLRNNYKKIIFVGVIIALAITLIWQLVRLKFSVNHRVHRSAFGFAF